MKTLLYVVRLGAAAAAMVCASPARVSAQTMLTVNVASADVYSYPSTGAIVIGHAPRGTVLAVTRELGSWVRVSWPAARDGVGYVHVSRGTLSNGLPELPRPSGLPAPPSATTPTSRVPVRGPAPQAAVPDERPRGASSVYVAPPTHLVGLGGRLGGATVGIGATARAWRRDRLGAEIGIARYETTSPAVGRVTSVQFEPSLLYSLPDRIGDRLWLRPYLGSGVNLARHTLSGVPSPAGSAASENRIGLQAFGGTELTFANLPRLAVSVDVGYHWAKTSFDGFTPGGPGVSVSGHWYVK
jgi:hypothetical protein